MLMTPRHPPRALRSLTTPTRPRRPTSLRSEIEHATFATHHSRPRTSGLEPHGSGPVPPSPTSNSPRIAVNRRSGAASVKGPRSWIYCRLRSFASVLLLCHDPHRLFCVCPDIRIVREPGGVRKRHRLAAGQGAGSSKRRPRPAPGGARKNRIADTGGGQPAASADPFGRSWSASYRFSLPYAPRWEAGAGPTSRGGRHRCRLGK